MNNVFFGELTFNTGWKAKTKISFFDQDRSIILKVRAYSETDPITSEQEDAYTDYLKHKTEKSEIIKRLLKEYAENAEERFIPTTLLFDQNGSYALLCDDTECPDEGIAVCLSPEEKVFSQDDYL